MRFDPTLIVRRMVVEREGAAVYDEAFHPGVNVVRGENSSGKSTVLNFIYYGLGGDLLEWSAAARLCSKVRVEVELNGNPATLSREITARPQSGMEIFGGGMEEALRAPHSAWLRYGYRRSESKESFSQALFRLLGIPEVLNDVSGNITMHQLLRLVYADQLSPVEHLFKYQGAFDDASLRDTIGRLIIGAYSGKLYENEQSIRSLNKEHDELTAEWRSLLSVLGKVEEGFTLEWFAGQRLILEHQAAALAAEVESIERRLFEDKAEDPLTLKPQLEAYGLVQRLQSDLAEASELRDNLALKIADSDKFLNSLKRKLQALQDASTVAEVVGEINFSECPVCQAQLEAKTSFSCYLCKAPYDPEQERGRIVALINDTAIQIVQSERLQEKRSAQAGEVDAKIAKIHSDWDQASKQLSSARRRPSTELQENLRRLHHEAGYTQRKLEDMREKERLAALLTELSERRASVRKRIELLQAENEALRIEQQDRIETAYTAIAEEVINLLINDLKRQDIFEDPKSVAFSFRENQISVNGERYFSASSRAILKSSFLLGLLAAATKVPFFRHPRFSIIDALENMGVEAVRSQNFQQQILRVSQEAKVDHQIIYATSMIAEELDQDVYTVGRYSTRANRTLTIS